MSLPPTPTVGHEPAAPPRGLFERMLSWLAAQVVSYYRLQPTLHGVPVPLLAQIVGFDQVADEHADVVEVTCVDGAPGDDLPLAIRVHPDDDPRDPKARRYIRDDSGKRPWLPVTGWARHMATAAESDEGEHFVPDLFDEEVARFPRQPYQVAVDVVAKAGRS